MQEEQDCFMQQVKMFYEEMREESIQNLRREHTAYNNLCEGHVELSDEKNAVLERMADKDKEIIKKFIDEIHGINNIEQQHIYLQGYQDCIKLLHLLRVFHD